MSFDPGTLVTPTQALPEIPGQERKVAVLERERDVKERKQKKIVGGREKGWEMHNDRVVWQLKNHKGKIKETLFW